MDWSNLTDEQVEAISAMVEEAYGEGWTDRHWYSGDAYGATPSGDWEYSSIKNQDLCVLRERFQEKVDE